MEVTIILVSYNTKELTRECIDSIYKETRDLTYEIYVVDNNSSDGTQSMLETFYPGVKVIKNQKNAGFGAANNQAIQECNGKYVLCLNTDTILLNNAVKIFYDYMETNKQVGACGGSLFDKDLKPVISYAPFPNLLNLNAFSWIIKSLFPKRFKKITKVKEVDSIIGADLFLRRAVLDEIGLFDERFFMYNEEIDLCYRIKKAHYNIKLVPEANIIHLEGKSGKNFWNNNKMRVKSKYQYLRKNSDLFCLYTFKLSYLLVLMFVFAATRNKDVLEVMNLHLRG